MSTNVTMPSMGFDMTEGKVSRWLKNVGDPVKRNETIGEIETEKATVDLSAPVDGVFAQILVQAGETVPVNTPIAVIAAQGETVGAPASAPSQPEVGASVSAPSASATKPTAQPKPQTEAQPQGPTGDEKLTPEGPTDREKEGEPPSSQTTPSQEMGTSAPAPATSTPPAPSMGDANGRIKASPIARNMAKAEGIDLAALEGSGPNGRIIERDVQKAVQAKKSGAPTAAAPQPAPATASAAALAPMVAGDQPLSKMRQTIARRLLESKQNIPHYYLTIEIFMGEAMKLREQLNALAANDAEKLSVNDLVVAAAARTLLKFPNVNAYFKGDKMETHDSVNIGIAVSVEDGLFTPVLHNADQKSLKQIAVETKELAARARANKMKPKDLGPGTFTVSNLGMYGIDEFAAIINPPESSILAVAVVKKVPVVLNDEIQVAQVMKVTLSADHRIVDGALGAQFLQALKKLLENPVNLLLS